MYKTILTAVVACVSLAGQAANSSERNPLSGRWGALTTVSGGFRYLGVTSDVPGVNAFRQGQHQEVLGGEFRFDKEAKYTLQTLAATGMPFNAGWNNSALGGAEGLYRIYWKQLYFSAKPVRGVEIQYGGLAVAQGAFSDIIGYSTNGYVTGERLALHMPKALFFDTISATYGYLGDLNSPDMTGRFPRLQNVNFRQYLVTKQLGRNVEASVQYTNQWGGKTFHQGVRVSTERLRVVDSIRAEVYERLNFESAAGFHLKAEKRFSRRFAAGGGYASIDRDFGDLNVDAFIHGNRLYATGEARVTAALTLFVLANHGVNNDYALDNRTHVQCGFSYDVLKTLQRSKL